MGEIGPSSDDRDLYLSVCRQCGKRKNAYWFRLNDDGVMVCARCAATDPYTGEMLKLLATPARREPPSRWSDRRHRATGTTRAVGKDGPRPKTRAERNEGRPDVMEARAPKRRGLG